MTEGERGQEKRTDRPHASLLTSAQKRRMADQIGDAGRHEDKYEKLLIKSGAARVTVTVTPREPRILPSMDGNSLTT